MKIFQKFLFFHCFSDTFLKTSPASGSSAPEPHKWILFNVPIFLAKISRKTLKSYKNFAICKKLKLRLKSCNFPKLSINSTNLFMKFFTPLPVGWGPRPPTRLPSYKPTHAPCLPLDPRKILVGDTVIANF